jgi:putative transposase
LEIRTLDLAHSPDEMLDQIATLADWMRQIRTQASLGRWRGRNLNPDDQSDPADRRWPAGMTGPDEGATFTCTHLFVALVLSDKSTHVNVATTVTEPIGAAVAEILADVAIDRPLPERILVDHGTEFTSKTLDAWAHWNQLNLDFSRRGKPGDNAHIEAFNRLVRRECLSQHWFTSLEEAGDLLERWKEEYNNDRPLGSLRQMPPAWYRAGGIPAQDRDEPETRRSAGSE